MTSHARNTHCVLSDTTENSEAIKLFVSNVPPHLGDRDAIVVAAPSALTSHLRKAITAASNRDQAGVNQSLRNVLEIQHALISQTLGEENADAEAAQFLGDVQSVIKLLKNIPDRATSQLVQSMGDIWTARLLAANLQLANISAESLVTSNLVRTRIGTYLSTDSTTRACLQKALAIVSGGVVVPAIAADELGHSTVCDANHFAAMVSRTLKSHRLTTWTNSVGVKSSRQEEVSNHVVPTLSQAEVAELSRLSHALFPSSDNIDSNTDVVVRHISGECHTQFTETPNPSGVKVVHTLDAVRILHIDCTGSDASTVASVVEKSLAKARIQPLATDVDKEGDRVSLAFPGNMVEYVRGVLRVNQFKAMSIEGGKALVAIVGDGLEADWLLSFKFQQTLGSSIRMTAKTDVSHIVIVDSPEAASEAVPTIHTELIVQDSPIAESSF